MRCFAVLMAAALFMSACGPGDGESTLPDRSAAEQAVSDTLDALHTAASEAMYNRYFNLYAEDAVFLGTDATERWTKAEFAAYARPRFEDGGGWSYDVIERHISVSNDGQFAWFDERLTNASLGETRGSGVLRHSDAGWRVVQYNLTIPVPNELATDVVQQIRGLTDND